MILSGSNPDNLLTETSMRKYKRTAKIEKEHLIGKANNKKHTWVCHKTKGFHSFELMFPFHFDYWKSNNFEHCEPKFKELFENVKTPEEYYCADDKWTKESLDGIHPIGLSRLFPRVRWWKCVNCGKQALDSENKPDKRIRDHINLI